MKISLPLLRRRPEKDGPPSPGFAGAFLPDRGEDSEAGTPWVPPSAEDAPPVPASATVIERSAGVHVPESDRVVHQAASLLLDYPDECLLADLPVLRAAVEEGVHGAAARHLLALVEHVESTPLAELQQHYVETFDMRRRCCLHLTYYAYGDTRRRGLALLDIKQTYQRCGATLRGDELPDHLCVVLDFAAGGAPAVGRTLLLDHRPGLELLRISLTERGSVYRHAVEAVSRTLPTLAGHDRDVVRTLIAYGPPDEQVGMEAYASGSHVTSGVRI
ncbi:nitrate reductase molybdenum cofactor assembly chaperone [Mobilicoccus pelagius]|uniref:Nitrate reductase delta subunit n=1 Tax=Mobilicoccus pelagius NBRC 104925 TaxID=1089455 RepID=H5UVY0_9MICO|nr:nitrate reductase molybdenum cofactor assembly chaperone [Mobilicoccus pelagius]GAB49888.1 nitrate reductase delta subunit [Mobilicoccus pelagius NBRC 104925]